MKKILLFIICTFLLLSVSPDLQKKYIRSGKYDIICYVSLNRLKNYVEGREYYWYKTGEVHNSVSQVGGLVLHDAYQKFFSSKQLAEHGSFDFGLKDGEWRTWYENGNIESVTNWKHGQKDGLYLSYDEDGILVLSGSYNNNKKSKAWINHKLRDTLYYKGDSTYTTKPKSKLNSFFSRVFSKQDSTEKAQKRFERQLKRRTDSIDKVERKKERENNKQQIPVNKKKRQ